MAGDREPVRWSKALLGFLTTTAAAGPCAFLLWGALGLVQRSGFDGALMFLNKLLDPSAVEGLALASLVGLLWSLPASIVNSLVQGLPAGVGWDSWILAALSGALASAFVVAGTEFSRSEGTDVQVAMIATGVLMGLLHWAIAIRPLRNLRKANDRSRALG